MKYALFALAAYVLLQPRAAPQQAPLAPQPAPYNPPQQPRDPGAQAADVAGAILGGIAGLVAAYKTETGR